MMKLLRCAALLCVGTNTASIAPLSTSSSKRRLANGTLRKHRETRVMPHGPRQRQLQGCPCLCTYLSRNDWGLDRWHNTAKVDATLALVTASPGIDRGGVAAAVQKLPFGCCSSVVRSVYPSSLPIAWHFTWPLKGKLSRPSTLPESRRKIFAIGRCT
ncbi:hypothetical protein IG631_24208 [Alternaria alternata]|nr:hypothetical protein IG631_24208 [Alternaria alternata]